MGIAAAWATASTLRKLAGCMAFGQALVMVSWAPAMTVPALPASNSSPWVLGAAAIGTTAAALAWRARWVWVYVGGTTVLVFIDRVVTSPQPLATPLQDALYDLMFDAVFAALALVSIRAGRQLDRTAEAAHQRARLEAATQARAQQKARANALMHDGVLATLLAAAHDDPIIREAASIQARKTLTHIEEFAAEEPTVAGLAARDFIWLQQAIATEVDPGSRFSYETEANDLTIPGVVSRAMSDGLTEALRNVLRHAAVPGRELHRAVHVRVANHEVEVTILDDGGGFDPKAVSLGRLGIAVIIREQMDQLAGGSVQLISKIGEGTRVVMRWEAS